MRSPPTSPNSPKEPRNEHRYPVGSAVINTVFLALRPFWALVDGIVKPAFAAVKTAVAMVMLAVNLPLQFALRLTPLSMLLRRFSHDDDILRRVADQAKMLAPEKRGRNLLIHGMRQEYAESVAPRAKYPLLWLLIPDHIRKSIVIDGMTISERAPAQALAGNTLTGEFVQQAYRAGVTAGIRAAYLSLIAAVFVAYHLSFGTPFQLRATPALASSNNPFAMAPAPQSRYSLVAPPRRPQSAPVAPSAQVDTSPMSVVQKYTDVWANADAYAVTSKLQAAAAANAPNSVGGRVGDDVTKMFRFVLLLIASVGVAYAAGHYVWLARFRTIVITAVDNAVSPLRKPWREGQQRFRDRMEERHLMLESYLDQILHITRIDNSPKVYLGRALGVAEFRGSLNAPRQYQEVYMTILDILQHVEFLGGSGEGKSRDAFFLILRQLMVLRKEGYPISMYIVDDKGAMAAKVRKLAKELGLEDEVLIIGTKPGDMRVDMLEGQRPAEVVEMLRMVKAQGGGATTGDFWSEAPLDIAEAFLYVFEAACCTVAGEAWEQENGIRMFSYNNLVRAFSSNDVIGAAIKMVLDALRSDEEYVRIAHLDVPALYDAIENLEENWLNLVDATKDGVKLNLRQMVKGLALRQELTKGFGDGTGENLIPITELGANKIKVINISQSKLGAAGRTVLIALRTARFKMARDAEADNPEFNEEVLNWWFDADPTDPEASKYPVEIFMGDEYHTQATGDTTSGLSDSGFWSIARSALIGGIFFTQGVGSWVEALGADATTKMRGNWRSHFVMRVDDDLTIADTIKNGGKTQRFRNLDKTQYESFAALKREQGIDVDNLPKVRWDKAYDNIPLWLNPPQTEGFYIRDWDEAFELDETFIQASYAQGQDGSMGVAASQAAAWRKEDKNEAAKNQGMYDCDLVKEGDFKLAGRARPFGSWQCGGFSMVDFVWFNADVNGARRQQLIEESIADIAEAAQSAYELTAA